MNKKYFALIRHGDYHQKKNTPSALQPYPLTEEGMLQAKNSASELEEFCQQWHISFDPTIDCSPLLRAWQTANEISKQIINSTASNHIESYEALVERKVGSVANLTVEEVEQVIADDPRYEAPPPNWKSKSDYRLPFMGAESLLEAGQRVASHLKKCAAEMNNESLKIIVGHGASIRHAALDLGLLELDDIPKLSMHHCKPVFFSLSETGDWAHVAGDWKVRSKHSKDNMD